MRELIIDEILDSNRWTACIDNGMEEELPCLETESNKSLLRIYHFYVLEIV